MKKKLITVLFLLFMTACSSGPTEPKDQLAEISTQLSKGYEMTASQRQEIDESVAQATKLLAEGKKEKASKILNKVLADLDIIEESDRFNKSE